MKCDTRERLHQIVELVERDQLETLADALVDSLKLSALERLADAIGRRVANG